MGHEQRAVVSALGDGLYELRLTRPQQRNAIDMDMVRALGAAAGELAAADDLRAVLVCADGPAFNVGGDLAHINGQLHRLADELDAMIGSFHATLLRLRALPVPVVAAVQGAAAGGGLGLMWIADVVIAAEDMRLATAFSRLGLSGDGASTWFLPRLVGERRARQMELLGRVVDAREALAWDVVDRVVPVAELAETALAQARELAAGPTVAFGQMKQLLDGALASSFEQQLAAEHAAMKLTGATADAAEGIASFAAKRAPRFTGR